MITLQHIAVFLLNGSSAKFVWFYLMIEIKYTFYDKPILDLVFTSQMKRNIQADQTASVSFPRHAAKLLSVLIPLHNNNNNNNNMIFIVQKKAHLLGMNKT